MKVERGGDPPGLKPLSNRVSILTLYQYYDAACASRALPQLGHSRLKKPRLTLQGTVSGEPTSWSRKKARMKAVSVRAT